MRRLDDFMPCPGVARYFRSSPVPVRRVKLLPENRSETVPARVPSPGAFGDVIVLPGGHSGPGRALML